MMIEAALVLAQANVENGVATRTREFLDWGALPDLWVIFLVVVPAVLLFAVMIYRRERPTGGRMKTGMAMIRALVILSVLLFLARPMYRSITYRTKDPLVLVLVDDSLSMQVVDVYSDRAVLPRLAELLGTSEDFVERETRYDLVRQLLHGEETKIFDRLRERSRVALYTFASSPRKVGEVERLGRSSEAVVSPRLPDASTFTGDERVQQTKLGDSVLEVLADTRDVSTDIQGLVGVVLLTDGQSNGGHLSPREMARKLNQRGIPLLAVGVGNPEPPQNIRVVNVDVSDMVLTGDLVPFDATIISEGFAGERVDVDLLFEDEVVKTKRLTLAGDGSKQLVRLQHRPERKGEFGITIRVAVLGGELFEEDNSLSRRIRVLDQKIKVLYVEGPPRWEYRYLKNALIRDPTMETQVLLLSADADFRQECSPGLLPLNRFPISRDELFPYHVVIVGDVLPQGSEVEAFRLSREQLELLRDFVSEAGGGVVFIAGEHANPQRYMNSPLESLLPVEIGDDSGRFERDLSKAFNVKLTGAGRQHPVMRLVNDPKLNRQLWENEDGIPENHLPGFYWFAEVGKLKLGAIALAVHPRLAHVVHGPRVLMAMQNYGKGQVFFSAVDTTWRFRAGVDNLYFYRFWGQVVRYVASGRLLGQTPRYNLLTDKLFYTIGEKIEIDARVYDANMKPLSDESITVYHSARGHKDEEAEAIELTWNKAEPAGSYDGSIVAARLGSHDFWIGTETEQLALRTVTVEVPPLEFRNPRMNREELKNVARLAEGKYYDLHEFTKVVEFLGSAAKPREIPVEESQDDLWDEPWVLFLFTGLISAEWILRKVFKLL